MQLVGFSWSTCDLSVCDGRQFSAVGSVGGSLLGLAGLQVISVFVMICSWMQLVGFSWSTCNLSVCDDRQFSAVGCSLLGLAGLHVI